VVSDGRHLAGAFAAMLFVGASWGANVPVTKVMLGYFDLMPMAAMRTAAATAALAVLLCLVEGRRALRYIVQTPSVSGDTLIVDSGEHLTGRPRDVAFFKEKNK